MAAHHCSSWCRSWWCNTVWPTHSLSLSHSHEGCDLWVQLIVIVRSKWCFQFVELDIWSLSNCVSANHLASVERVHAHCCNRNFVDLFCCYNRNQQLLKNQLTTCCHCSSCCSCC
jgi:hypothetical protein